MSRTDDEERACYALGRVLMGLEDALRAVGREPHERTRARLHRARLDLEAVCLALTDTEPT